MSYKPENFESFGGDNSKEATRQTPELNPEAQHELEPHVQLDAIFAQLETGSNKSAEKDNYKNIRNGISAVVKYLEAADDAEIERSGKPLNPANYTMGPLMTGEMVPYLPLGFEEAAKSVHEPDAYFTVSYGAQRKWLEGKGAPPEEDFTNGRAYEATIRYSQVSESKLLRGLGVIKEGEGLANFYEQMQQEGPKDPKTSLRRTAVEGVSLLYNHDTRSLSLYLGRKFIEGAVKRETPL